MASPTPTEAARHSRTRRNLAVAGGVGLIVVIILLSRLSCSGPEPEPEAQQADPDALLVPAEMADRFGLKTDEIVAYCRKSIHPQEYSGILRGAYGALWTGRGNDWDRALLAAEALRGRDVAALIVPEDTPRVAVPDGAGWKIVRLDNGESETVEERPAGAVAPSELPGRRPELFHRLRPTLRLHGADGKTREVGAAQGATVADWVYRPVVLETRKDSAGLHYELRDYRKDGPQTLLKSDPLADVRRAELELTWTFGKTTRTWRRELFDRANSDPKVPGHAAPRAGDRYAVTVALGPLRDGVCETRLKMMAGNSYTPLPDEISQDLQQMGTRYFIDSDGHTLKLAKRTGVDVRADVPRIIVAACEPLAEPSKKSQKPDPSGFSLDVLCNEVHAAGERAREFHVARGLADDMIEGKILFQATGLPVVSASSVLSRLKSARPESPRRRIQLIRDEAYRMLQEEPLGTRMRLTGRLPRRAEKPASQPPAGKAEADAPALFIERTSSGLVLHGIGATAAAKNKRAAALKRQPPYQWGASHSVDFGSNVAELALVADAMLAHRMQCADYHLQFHLLRALSWEPIPVTAGCVLKYRVNLPGKKVTYSMNVPVFLKKGKAAGKWMAIPSNKTWISTNSDNYGDVTGAWPDVIGLTREGPSLESFLAPEEFNGKGKPRTFRLQVGTRTVDIEASEVAVDSRAGALIELKSGRTWQPAVFARENGLIRRRFGRYLARRLGTDLDSEQLVSAGSWRPLDPREMQVEGRWSLVNVLQAKDGRSLVQLCGRDKPAEWVDPSTLRPVRLAEVRQDGKWQPANVLKEDAAQGYRVHLSGTEDGADRWFAKKDVRFPQQDVPAKSAALLLNAHRFPLLLAWKQGKTWISLERITPVVTGKVTDRRTGLPVAGAVVSRSDGRWKVRSAADGSFGIPVDDPLRPTCQLVGPRAKNVPHPSFRGTKTFNILVLADRSASGSNDDGQAAERGRRWRERAAKTLQELISGIASRNRDRVKIGLWAFPSDAQGDSKKPDTNAVREVVKFPASASDVLQALKTLKRTGSGSLGAAIARVGRLHREEKLPRDLIVVLLSSGEHAEGRPPAEVYREWNGRFPVFVFQLQTGAAGDAGEQLRRLALVSGGTCQTIPLSPPAGAKKTSPQPEKTVSVRLHVEAEGFAPDEIVLPMRDAGKRAVAVSLDGGCPCGSGTTHKTELLVIGKKNVGDLRKCAELAPKARKMIERRVAGGKWTVTIPNRRVNIAGVTAYGWFETELATGRMIGRTEDGLHGAVPSPRWPSYTPRAASNQPFVAWYQGLVAYTTGSVLSAMQWHREPGFPGTPDDFKRYVQANALEFAMDWWSEVGSQSFPGMDEYYWSGVCLNFTLQSKALGLPSTGCARRWAEDFCSRMFNAARDQAVDNLKDLFNKQFRKEWQSFSQHVGETIADELQKRMEDRWNAGVKGTCAEMVNAVLGKPK